MKEMKFEMPEEMPQTYVIEHCQTAQNLLVRRAIRNYTNCISSAGLAPQMLKESTWDELQQMHEAIVQRLEQQNQNWLDGIFALAKDYSQLKQANTMTKLMEQQFNLFGQFGKLLSQQATNLLGLQENIEVDFGYWVNQKIKS